MNGQYQESEKQSRSCEENTREARLVWFGHARKKTDGYVGRRMLRMDLPGKIKRERPKQTEVNGCGKRVVEVTY